MQPESFVSYLIEVRQLREHGRGFRSWAVRRRYSDFDRFHQKLGMQPGGEALPGKKWFGNLSPGFVSERQHQLNLYLERLCLLASQVRSSAPTPRVEIRSDAGRTGSEGAGALLEAGTYGGACKGAAKDRRQIPSAI